MWEKKRVKEISEMREGKKKNECKKGGAASIKGGAEIKREKKEREALVGLVLDLGLGRFGSTQKACI